jgi:transketolase
MLHVTGYDLSLDDLKRFRQLDSVTAGHPENVLHPAIEVSTGPLGQGLSNAVGMAMAQAHLAAEFNQPGFPVMDSHVYVICGDGCMQEGITSEASSLAGHLGLGRLIVLYDDNHITIDGETGLSFTEDVLARYAAYGWHTEHVKDGDNDLEGLLAAIGRAQAVTGKAPPSQPPKNLMLQPLPAVLHPSHPRQAELYQGDHDHRVRFWQAGHGGGARCASRIEGSEACEGQLWL